MRDDDLTRAIDKQREVWKRDAPRYDRAMSFWEKHLFGDARQWLCSQASGNVLEVGIGTGLNLPYYPPDVHVTGVDLSPEMLGIARQRAADLGRAAELHDGNAHELEFDDASFDTVVCTFSLCNIPDDRRALAEMNRVLRPGGLLLLADHVASTNRAVLIVQKLLNQITVRLAGEHLTRRPFPYVIDANLAIEHQQRYKAGVVERLAARKPPEASA